MKEETSLQLLSIIVPSCTVVLVGYINSKRLTEIHLLVNSQLQKALDKIVALEKRIRGMTPSSDESGDDVT